MPRTATLEELFFRMTEGADADAAAAALAASSTTRRRRGRGAPTRRRPSRRRSAHERRHRAPAPRVRSRGSRPGVGTVYRWELRKLRAQKRTYLGLGAAAIVPLIFVAALLTGSGGPDDVPFGRYVRETGLAIPLVGLLFSSVWLFPLITALVAGDIVASEDNHGTLKTILTRSTERWQIFAGKLLAALTYAFVALVIFVSVGLVVGGLIWGFDPLTTLSGTQVSAGRGMVLIAAASLAYFLPMMAIAGIAILLSTVTHNSAGAIVGTLIASFVMQLLGVINALDGCGRTC